MKIKIRIEMKKPLRIHIVGNFKFRTYVLKFYYAVFLASSKNCAKPISVNGCLSKPK